MQCHNISDFEDDESDPKNINNIINKYESKIGNLADNKNKNKINDIIDNKSSDFTSQNSRRTKNSSNFSQKNKIGNIKVLIEDSNNNYSSSIGSKSIKSNKNSKNININDVEINIENINNINHNINNVNKININNEIKNIPTNLNIKNDQKIMDKNNNNTSIYDTSFNMLFNPFDYNKFFLNKPKNLTLSKLNDKGASNIMKNIMNIQDQKLKKENDELKNQLINNNKIKNKINKDKYIKDKHKNYLNKLFKNKKVKSRKKNNKKKKKIKEKKNNIKINSNANTNINTNNKAKRKNKVCNYIFWLNIIRNIILFIIISSTLTFYSIVLFVK